MSKQLREEISGDPEYLRCAFSDMSHPAGDCAGRITREHAIIYAGRKIQERWAIIPCCAKHHAVDQFQDAGTIHKEMNVWVALNRATEADLSKYERSSFKQQLRYLNGKYGVYVPPPVDNKSRSGSVFV